METKIKKRKSCILILLSVIFLGGCETGDFVTPSEKAKMQTNAVMECVINKDKEGLIELFCPYLKGENFEMDEDVTLLFQFIKGEIVSYDESEGSRGAGSRTSEGITIQELRGKIENIKTDTGNHYRIAVGSYSINKQNPEYVGITGIGIWDQDTYDPETGYPDYGQYYIDIVKE